VSRYLQTSTANPYGHRPWATRLYTGFEDYGFLKQPQNLILREDLSMRPELYKPPELKSEGLGDVTIVGGSGKILRRGRRRTLGAIMPRSTMILAREDYWGTSPISYPPRPLPVPPVRTLPPVMRPPTLVPSGPPPIKILPPSMVPPPPRPVSSGPGGTVYALPGDATTPGSPFAPPAAGQLPIPAGAVPVSLPAAPASAAPVADTSAAPATRTFSEWFNAADYFASVPNGYLAIAATGALYLFSRKKK
jgi:hypothetical protein